MQRSHFKTNMIKAVLVTTVLLLGASLALAQQQINLTAGPSSITLPDGNPVPMWGYSCGAAVTGSTATCAALNTNAAAGAWSPVVITVPTGQGLTINLTNSLSFTAGTGTNTVPTSLMIVGQVGGGLGTPTAVPSPAHANQYVTWSTVGNSNGATFIPPNQANRVQSFGTEVSAGATTALTWAALRPGTYLLESGTHPSIQVPMGLYGILVVTAAPSGGSVGTAYPGVSYSAEVPLEFSEIDPNQNNAVQKAVTSVGFSENAVIALRDSVSAVGLTLSSGVPVNAGTGYKVGDPVTFTGGGGSGAAAQVADIGPGGSIVDFTVTSAGKGYTSVPTAVVSSPTGSGAMITATLSLAGDLCGNGASACYPPAVNYTPLYYLINGVAFSKATPGPSLFPTMPATGVTGNVLVRLVNAGSRMHVPAIVGSQTTQPVGTGSSTVTGFSIIAEDGNPAPGVPKVQSDVFMAAGKTFDVMINAPATVTTAIPVFDRELSLSGNAINRDSGMLAYIGINGAGLPAATGALTAAVANPDTYNALIAGQTLTISDPSKGVLANDVNVFGVQLDATKLATNGTVTLNTNGTFTYVPTGNATSDSFGYCANGTTQASLAPICTTVTLGASNIADSGITCSASAFSANISTYLAIKTPGVLANCTDGAKLPMTVDPTSVTGVTGPSGMVVVADANGGFTVSGAQAGGPYSFAVTVKDPLGMTAVANVSLTFPSGSGLKVTVLDGSDKTTVIGDYRWVIEEDRTFYINPGCTVNPPPAGCTTTPSGIVPTLGTNFHTSYMPYIAQGCTGPQSCEGGQTVLGQPAVCDVGNGVCRPDTTGSGFTPVTPDQVYLDPSKRYYISVLPGDAANPFYGASANGHGMGGAPISCNPIPPATTCTFPTAVTVLSQPSPYPPSKLSVFVFEDDFPLNGEQDGGGGIDVLSPNEPGLGQFQIHLWDAMGGNGDFTGQMTYDMFNQPLSNSLAGTIDPVTQQDACPISVHSRSATDPTSTGITGMIVTCPKYEADGKTLSPLAGQAVIANLMPGRFGVVATPGSDRIASGEEWLQTNTLDGQKAHDSFVRIGEPSYFQEFGPAGYHVSIGFANPKIINARLAGVCNGTDPNITGNCSPGNTLTGTVTGQRLSRTPDERLYSSGSHDTFYWTQCFVSVGDPDGEDFAFTKCDDKGHFTLTGLPDGDWRLTTFDQWNDQLVDGLSTPVRLGSTTSVCPGAGSSQNVCNMGDVAATQWQTNLYTRTFIDDNRNGIAESTETGIPFANVAVRLRDGSLENLLLTDFTGTANFNETFPLFAWYTVETDVTRYKNTGTHVVYDVGGPADGSAACGVAGYPPCGSSTIGKFLANTQEQVSVPANLRVPGAVYCKDADCSTHNDALTTGIQVLATGTNPSDLSNCSITGGTVSCGNPSLSSGRIDPPWIGVEGWQGFPGQNSFVEFGKAPYFEGENGGIKGHVIYASTRPFDDPQMLVQTQWEPLVPHVGINLYQEGVASDGVTPTLTLVDHTQTSSFDDWAQGFHNDGTGNMVPNMNCPGQSTADLFYFSLFNQPNYLDYYQHGASGYTPLPGNSQFKCYDGMHDWNQVQPAPYDGAYQFPSVTSVDPATGRPNGTNCTICSTNPDPSPTTGPDADPLRSGLPMLPIGKYVVEVVLPPGYELVKEEDKNILIGDNFIAPVTQQFGGLGNVFILPDQASIGSAYNSNNPQNPTQSLGMNPTNGIVPGFVPEPTWPCVGEARVVPDYISLYPQSHQVSPFAGATRNLCDRKEVTLNDQMGAIAKFYIYTSTHIASKFTGGITDDYTSEFDPFSPQFGEKFAPPDLPVSVKDWTGNEINRVYADHWGAYDGMTYSTWEVNPPNPTGYSPTMAVFCMNDPGPIAGPNGTIIKDPQFTEGYSQFCYELPFMPGTTQYLDTPVVPTSAFAGAGYNNVDCAYPDATPAISEVDGDGVGPWVANDGNTHTLTITALGDQTVPNYGYSGPSANTAPFNSKTITRHYNFGSQCTSPVSGSPTCNTLSTVTVGGVPLTNVSWSPTSITGTVNLSGTDAKGNPIAVPQCNIQQQQPLYAPAGTPTAYCGELVITAGNGKQSIDTVTVTIGGKAPTHVPASGTIQSAIDAAQPGDLLIVDPTCNAASGPVACTTAGATTNTTAAHNELLLMWKPVRLQGVGAVSTIINANTHPSFKMDAWRARVDCLFGISLDGQPISSGNPYDSTGAASCPGTGWNSFVGGNDPNNPQIDRLPLEATLGWDASLNGNLAELLQEPSLMGALEGAGITVLAKGVYFPSNPFDSTLLAGFPTGTILFTADNTSTPLPNGHTPCDGTYPSNFQCNPSSIDGLGITNSSQGGGGIFIHGWGHNIQVANNRVANNAGTLSGGINVGQGEFPPNYIQGGATNAPPGSCETSPINGQQLPYCHNTNVNVHHNYVSLNSSTGDELFSATPAGAGGVSFCTGSDYYKFQYNWVCGNLSSGDGGGLGHLGFSKNGDIEHNSILFNQSTNPTLPANGGGMIVMGTPDVDPPCGATTDADCVPPLGSVGPSDGVGPNLVINANLIMGNSAESGSGGGIAFQSVNGGDVLAFPTDPTQWHHVIVTNNIIADNVAGWDGGGVSFLDALNLDFVNNTVVANTTTASAGVLANTLGAPLASTQNGNVCTGATGSCGTATPPQPAGMVSIQNSATLTANINQLPAPGQIVCPAGHYAPTGTATDGTCRTASYPLLANNILWQNSAYQIGVGSLSAAFQQNVVSLFNAVYGAGNTTTGSPAVNQLATGSCVAGTSYWDIGVRGDTGPADHSSTVTLNPLSSILSSGTGYDSSNSGSNPLVVSQYCNGSRVPPEACSPTGGCGWAVPPGISDATVPNPIFNLTPVATVDEGNNWINMRWGPLSLVNPATGTTLGNYSITSGSPAVDAIGTSSPTFAVAPSTDFFGNPRPDPGVLNKIDIGAVEIQIAVQVPTLTSIAPSSGLEGTSVPVTLTGTHLAATTGVNVPAGSGITVTNLNLVSDTSLTATFTIAANAAPGPVNVTVVNPAGTSNAVSFTVLAPTLNSITPSSGPRGYSTPVTLSGVNLTGATAVNVPAGSGITVTSFTPVNGTTVTATFAIATTAPLAADNITVSVGAATSNAVQFTVTNPPVPTLTSITPSTGVKKANGNTAVPVTLTGTSLLTTTGIIVSGTGVTPSNVVVVNDSTVTATFTITQAAATGPRSVTINTLGGTSNAVTFTVAPTPHLNSIVPATGARNSIVPVTLNGSGLTGTTAASINVSGTGVNVSNVNVVSDASVTATFTVASNAALTSRTVTVTLGAGVSNSVTFTVVNAAPPVLTSITPAAGLRGTSVPVTLAGTGLTGATAMNFIGGAGGVSITQFTPVNDTTITATLNIPTTAALGGRNINVTTPGGSSNTVQFTVQGPTLTSISPATGARGTSVSVTFTGTNLLGANGIQGFGNNVTVTNFTVVNATTVTATFNINGGAPTGTRTLDLTTANNGTTNTVPFQVVNPPAPTLTSVAPSSGVRGTTVAVTLTGTNFTATGTTVNVTGPNITVSGVTVVSSTQITASFTIAPGTTLGGHNVSVSNPNTTSNSQTFTVQGPTLASINPTSGLHGSTFPMTLNGANLTGATTISVSGTGVSCTIVPPTTSSTLNANCTITSGATRNGRTLTVVTPIGTTNGVTFTVQ